jgi:hypothetical protein
MNSLAPTNSNPLLSSRRRRQRIWQIAALWLLVLISGIGCDPISTVGYFLVPFSEHNVQPSGCALTLPKKESTVVIICTHEDLAATEFELKTADVDICNKLVHLLNEQFKENGDKVKIVEVSKVNGYLKQHADWVTMPKQAIGKHFNADFVVYLELGHMSIWEEGSRKTLCRGRAEVRMSVIEVNQAEGESPKWSDVYNLTGFPAFAAEEAGSSTVAFRQKYYQKIAKDLTGYFVAHPPADRSDNFN